MNAIVKEKVFILKDNRRTLILSQNNAENHLVQCVEGIFGSRYGFSGNCHTNNEKKIRRVSNHYDEKVLNFGITTSTSSVFLLGSTDD